MISGSNHPPKYLANQFCQCMGTFYLWGSIELSIPDQFWKMRCQNFPPLAVFTFEQLLIVLRVRAFFHKAVRVCHVYCNFKIGFTCRITVIFGTLKDGSLLINTLASNICFSYRNMFQNGVDALSKIVDAFLSKSSKFHLVRIIRLCSNFASLWHKHLLSDGFKT